MWKKSREIVALFMFCSFGATCQSSDPPTRNLSNQTSVPHILTAPQRFSTDDGLGGYWNVVIKTYGEWQATDQKVIHEVETLPPCKAIPKLFAISASTGPLDMYLNALQTYTSHWADATKKNLDMVEQNQGNSADPRSFAQAVQQAKQDLTDEEQRLKDAEALPDSKDKVVLVEEIKSNCLELKKNLDTAILNKELNDQHLSNLEIQNKILAERRRRINIRKDSVSGMRLSLIGRYQTMIDAKKLVCATGDTR